LSGWSDKIFLKDNVKSDVMHDNYIMQDPKKLPARVRKGLPWKNSNFVQESRTKKYSNPKAKSEEERKLKALISKVCGRVRVSRAISAKSANSSERSVEVLGASQCKPPRSRKQGAKTIKKGRRDLCSEVSETRTVDSDDDDDLPLFSRAACIQRDISAGVAVAALGISGKGTGHGGVKSGGQVTGKITKTSQNDSEYQFSDDDLPLAVRKGNVWSLDFCLAIHNFFYDEDAEINNPWELSNLKFTDGHISITRKPQAWIKGLELDMTISFNVKEVDEE
jgi:hypothetical protein